MENKIDQIKTKDEYLNLFSKEALPKKPSKVSEALKVALDTRKFEIEMYWKRATYFWAFIAATFTGFFVLLNSDNIDNHRGFTILISVMGLFFSIGWNYVNRGSKHWQENWERHVAYLEDEVQGPLFKYVKYPDTKFKQFNKGYHFSVSKVNQLLSLMMVAFWFILFVYSVFFSFHKLWFINDSFHDISVWIPILICSAIFIPIFYFTKGSLSFLKDIDKDVDKTISDEELKRRDEFTKFLKRN